MLLTILVYILLVYAVGIVACLGFLTMVRISNGGGRAPDLVEEIAVVIGYSVMWPYVLVVFVSVIWEIKTGKSP